jgi:hypothetical protein
MQPDPTAILLLIFNRPEETRQVLSVLRTLRPARLYVAGDGPRPGRGGEPEAVAAARAAATDVDWDCDVATLFRDANLGCRRAVSGALDWFFDQEPEGIVLEDDCVPDRSFFAFCSELLARYRDDRRIMAIAGNNFQGGWARSEDSYYFSRYNHCWGWASWRRAWALYDRELAGWPEFRARGYLADIGDQDPDFVECWTKIFDRSARGETDSWAYRWTFSCWQQSGLTCLPRVNLVENIGFGPAATHTKAPHCDTRAVSLAFPLHHPPSVVRDVVADTRTTRLHFGIGRKSWKRRVLGRIAKLGNLVKQANPIVGSPL